MLDIKGQQVNIGDRVLVSTKSNGLVLTTLLKMSKTHFYFANEGVERLDRYKKLQYMGSTYYHPDGTPWDSAKHGRVDYFKAIRKNQGDNGSKYKLKDMTDEKQVRVLKVEDDFSL